MLVKNSFNNIVLFFHIKDDNKDDIEPEIKTSEVQRDESLPDFDSLLPDFDSLLPAPIDSDDNDNGKVVEGINRSIGRIKNSHFFKR